MSEFRDIGGFISRVADSPLSGFLRIIFGGSLLLTGHVFGLMRSLELPYFALDFVFVSNVLQDILFFGSLAFTIAVLISFLANTKFASLNLKHRTQEERDRLDRREFFVNSHDIGNQVADKIFLPALFFFAFYTLNWEFLVATLLGLVLPFFLFCIFANDRVNVPLGKRPTEFRILRVFKRRKKLAILFTIKAYWAFLSRNAFSVLLVLSAATGYGRGHSLLDYREVELSAQNKVFKVTIVGENRFGIVALDRSERNVFVISPEGGLIVYDSRKVSRTD